MTAPLNKADKAGYAIGIHREALNRKNAETFLVYLVSDNAQKIYEKYGFSRASPDELKIKPIPAGNK